MQSVDVSLSQSLYKLHNRIRFLKNSRSQAMASQPHHLTLIFFLILIFRFADSRPLKAEENEAEKMVNIKANFNNNNNKQERKKMNLKDMKDLGAFPLPDRIPFLPPWPNLPLPSPLPNLPFPPNPFNAPLPPFPFTFPFPPFPFNAPPAP